MSGKELGRQAVPPSIYSSPHVDNLEVNNILKANILKIGEFVLGEFFVTVNPVTISDVGDVVYTSAQVLAGIINRDPQGSSRTDTLPTAAQIVNGLTDPTTNTYFYVIINNTDNTNNYDITLSPNTGVTLQNNIVLRYSSAYLVFLLTNVSAGTEAVSVYSVGTNMIKSESGVAKNTYTDNSIIRWDGATGEYIQKSTVIVNDLGLISGVATPVSDNDVATKKYVDDEISGVKWKQPVRCVSTGNVALNGVELPVNTDGVTLVDNDRILVIAQTNGIENGAYLYNTSGVWQRTTDVPIGLDAANIAFNVQEGTVNADKSYVCTNDSPNDIVGSFSLVFSLFTEVIQAGKALTKTNGVLDVNVDNTTIVVDTLSNNLVCTIFPVGTTIQNVSDSISGYLLCDGTSYTRATYQDLFDVLNTSKGVCTLSIATPALVTLNGHGLITGQTVFITTSGALPTGVSSDTTYWVTVIDANTFRISSSYSNLVNGVFVNTSGVQSGVHTLSLSIGGVTSSLLFNVPDTSGRVVGNASSTKGVGSVTGSETHTLDITEMPAHTHDATVAAHTHTFTDQYNTYTASTTGDQIWAPLDENRTFATGISGTATTTTKNTGSTTAGAGGTSSSTGGGLSYNIMQPTFFLYTHIKY